MADRDFLFDLAGELRRLVRPLERALESEAAFAGFLEQHGYQLDAAQLDLASLRDVLALAPELAEFARLVSELVDQDEIGLAQYLELVDATRRLVGALRTLAAQPPRGIPAGAWQDLARELLDRLLVEYLFAYQQGLHALLTLTGVVEYQPVAALPAPGRIDYVRRAVRWDRLPQSVSDPLAFLKESIGWNDVQQALDPELVLRRVVHPLASLGVPLELADPPPALRDAYYAPNNPHAPQVEELRLHLLTAGDPAADHFRVGLFVYPVPATGPGGAPGGVVIGPLVDQVGPVPESALGQYSVEVGGAFAQDRGVRLEILPSGVTGVLAAPGGDLDAVLGLYDRPFHPLVLLGSRFSNRLEIDGWGLRLQAGGAVADPEIAFTFSLEDGRAILDPTSFDGFLRSLFGDEPQAVHFSGAVTWSSRSGLRFSGSAGLVLNIPLHLSLGVVSLDHVTLGAFTSEDGLDFSAALSGGAQLGPVAASVEELGMRLRLSPVAAGQPSGRLGGLDLDFDFQPPRGLGLAIDAGPVSGGGYLFFDHANGRYAGIVQLSIYSISVTAIGLLDTRRSDGQPLPSPGFSFLLVVSAEFPPLQLGFGFTLNGVGGLAGLHRTCVTEALQSGIRNGSVDHLLFPEDPVRNAPQIISDLRSVFPPRANRYVFGPMAILGWGSPSLVEGEIGLILELPEPIRLVLLGQLNVALPEKDAAVVELHIDVLGILDFGRKLLSIDARLYDSRIAAFSVYGDMALRLGWGERPSFAMGVGGLNPHFQAPPEFPVLRRMTISLGFEDNPRIGVQGYMAVTSNSVQFGARAELYAGAGGLNVYGWLLFDALLTLRPFFFRFDYSHGFALRRGDDVIAGIHLTGTLSGPQPYHVRGEACISILFWDLCVRFDVQFGERQSVVLPETDLWSLLEPALRDTRNWNASLPAGIHTAVSLKRPAEDDAPLLLHPMGSATLRQRVVPLNRELDRFGEFRIPGAKRFDITGVAIGDDPAGRWETVLDLFAPGQFEDLSDAEKLSRDSFEEMVAGVSLGSRRAEHGAPRSRTLEYETRIVDSPWDSRGAPAYRPSRSGQLAMGQRGAKARSALRHSGAEKYAPPPGSEPAFALDDEEFTVAGTADLAPLPELGRLRSRGAAQRRLRDHLEAHPEQRGRLQVVSLDELAGAA